MTKHGADKLKFLLVDGYNIPGLSREFSDNLEALTEECHGFSEEWVKHTATGIKRGNLELNAWFDDDEAATHEVLGNFPGLIRVVSYGVEGNVIGKRAVCWKGAMQSNYNRIAVRGELHKATVSMQSSGEVDEGLILHGLVQEEGNGDTKANKIDNGSATENGAIFYLQVTQLDLDGLDDVVVRIIDSANGTDWDTLKNFTAVEVAPHTERVIVEGTVRRYLAVEWAFTGLTTEEPTITFLVVAKRK